MKLPSVLLVAAALSSTAFAGVNTIYLKDGRSISGRFVDGNSGNISFQDDNGRDYRFPTGDVDRIVFSFDAAVYNGPPPENIATQQNPPRVLAEGTEIAVRTTTPIDSRDAADNQIFSATVERDVLDGSGNVVIPRGSPAELVVRDSNGGARRGSSNLILDVQAVSINGHRFVIDTQDLRQTANGRQGVGANRRTGEYVGGGAVLGTLLGAVAGGGKGALIGALAGAAAGAGTQILTKGGQVRVPSETVLTFRIDRPVYMNDRY